MKVDGTLVITLLKAVEDLRNTLLDTTPSESHKELLARLQRWAMNWNIPLRPIDFHGYEFDDDAPGGYSHPDVKEGASVRGPDGSGNANSVNAAANDEALLRARMSFKERQAYDLRKIVGGDDPWDATDGQTRFDLEEHLRKKGTIK